MDRYTLFARICPVIIFLLPIIVVSVTFSIEIEQLWAAISGTGLSLFLGYFLSNISRELGKKKQEKLWQSWGGAPTSQILSYNNTVIDNITKRRYHTIMMNIIKETKCEDIQTKTNDEQSEIFRSWTTYLRDKTRDIKRYPLIFKENVNYGFRRNLWGLKKIEIVVLLITITGNYVYYAQHYGYKNFYNFPFCFYCSELIVIFLMILWMFFVTESWIKTQAFTYAERLIEAIDSLKDKGETK